MEWAREGEVAREIHLERGALPLTPPTSPDGNCFDLPPLDFSQYRGTSLMTNSGRLGPYRRTMPRAIWWS